MSKLSNTSAYVRAHIKRVSWSRPTSPLEHQQHSGQGDHLKQAQYIHLTVSFLSEKWSTEIMKLKEILLVLLLVAVVSEAVRNKRNRRNKKEAQQQQQQQQHQQRVARQQQQPRQQRQQQQPQGQRGSRQQRRPNRPAPRRRPRQQQRPQRPRTGAQRAQDFNLPDLKKLTNTKFNCDENKRWSMNYSSNTIMWMYQFVYFRKCVSYSMKVQVEILYICLCLAIFQFIDMRET